MSKSRRNKKVWKKAIIIYDVASLPVEEGVDFEKLMDLIRNQGIVLYNSSSGDKPRVIPKRSSTKFKFN